MRHSIHWPNYVKRSFLHDRSFQGSEGGKLMVLQWLKSFGSLLCHHLYGAAFVEDETVKLWVQLQQRLEIVEWAVKTGWLAAKKGRPTTATRSKIPRLNLNQRAMCVVRYSCCYRKTIDLVIPCDGSSSDCRYSIFDPIAKEIAD